jgi:hypothetical protein
MPQTRDHTTKQPYDSPKLFVFGDLRELTKHSSSTPGMIDNGMNDKTS